MQALAIPEHKNFVGRKREFSLLHAIDTADEPAIVILYGRRRVGKTELLEQAFRERNILKFEGIEGLDENQQMARAVQQLANYTKDKWLGLAKIESWSVFFELLFPYVEKGKWTLYFEELQWLANYSGQMIAELKYAWDNYFRRNSELIVVLCGSSPSFMLDKVVHSKALYNRSQYEIHLKEFNIIEAQNFLKNKNEKEVFNAYLSVGGIPEYLKWLKKDSSVFLSLCNNSFASGSFFSREYEKIFTSSMEKNKYYRKIIEVLSEKKFCSRNDLMKALKISTGGNLTDILVDLKKSGFIEKYTPLYLKENSKLVRYMISDNYLQFYFKFIWPIQDAIENGDYNTHPTSAIKADNYAKWLGFAFERWCRKYHYVIAKILGFSAVQYKAGVFFSRATEKENPGYQMDLIFDRTDHVCTICEIKYIQKKVGTDVIEEMEKKLSLFKNKGNKTLHKVLICTEGADLALIKRAYFDEILTLNQFLNPTLWQ